MARTKFSQPQNGMTVKVLVALLGLFISHPLFAATLRVHVVDQSGAPAWVRREVRGAGEKAFYPQEHDGALRDLTSDLHGIQPLYAGSFIVQDDCRVEAPAGNYRIVAEHGTEYRREERSVTVDAQSAVYQRCITEPYRLQSHLYKLRRAILRGKVVCGVTQPAKT